MKIVFYQTLLLLLMLTTWHVRAQDQQLYSFSLKASGELLTYSQGSLLVTIARTGANKMAQCFIVKRLDNGKTLIGAAAKPGLFLKREGSNLALAPYIEADASFEWYLGYSGYPYTSLMQPGTTNALGWQGGNFSMLSVSPGLTTNDDTTGDHYRFGMSTVTNTF